MFDTKVAYVTAQPREGRDRTYSLIVSDMDGENDNVIMESKDPIMSPAWSPDSRRLAYVSFEDKRSTVFVQTLRTGNRIKVSSKPRNQRLAGIFSRRASLGTNAGRR